jgi:hypothetical protein
VRQEQERLFLPSQVVKPHKDSGLRARLVELLRLVWRRYTVQREMCHIPLPSGAPPETGIGVADTAGLPSNELEMSPPWVYRKTSFERHRQNRGLETLRLLNLVFEDTDCCRVCLPQVESEV